MGRWSHRTPPQHHPPYREFTPPDPMKRLLLLALTAVTLLMGTTAIAHHDGTHGHQDTSGLEGDRKSAA
jgi:hypothetical protein